ncbi:MAG: type I 3-dehydroquinate dehydratase [Planctomycetes bacterium]|nr:type I 3-dehydroquinate dehydratase [Planctomycetota bacterium]
MSAAIIASIFAESREQVMRQAARAAMAGADWIELRLDLWPAAAELAPVIEAIRLPVLVACRTPEDGGRYRGTLGERRELFGQAMAAGAQGLDLEHWETWTPSVGRNRLRLLVRSFHSFTGVPKELPAIQDKLFAQQGTVAKIAVTAHDLADAAPVLDLLGATDQRRRPTVAFAMGRTAWPTRVLACALGAPFVYAAVEPGQETAPGQLSVDLLAGLFRVRELSGSTALFGLLGNPALASLGPWLHNRVFRRLGRDAIYLPLETSRPEAVLAMLPRRQLRGVSVTAPFKNVLAQQCHKLAPEAAAIGVVNTMLFEAHGMVVGHNTDVVGVLGALQRAGVGGSAPAGAVGVVLGTGGAARAGAIALQGLGYQVTMLGRTLESARAFAAHHGFRLGSLTTATIEQLRPQIVIHATPVGSPGRAAEPLLLPDWRPAPTTAVLDMVYQPYWTPLLEQVRVAGAIAIPGAEMFLTQAREQVRLFTGETLPEAELRQFLAGTAVTAA